MRLSPFVKYILRRIFFAFLTFIAFAIIIFAIPRIIPGNPLAVLLTRLFKTAQANPELIRVEYRRLMEEFGFNKPWWLQLTDFLSKLFRGDLGTSISFYPTKVMTLLSYTLPWTIGLLFPAIIISWVIGNWLGAWAAVKRGTAVDNVLLTTFIVLSQTPYFWLAMLLVYALSIQVPLFPVGGTYSLGLSPSFTPEFILDYLYHLTLPLLSIAISAIGGWAIGMRVMTIYEMGSDYVIFSDTLGLPDGKIFRYAFKNASLPQVAGLVISFGTMLGGALITEIVFNYQGTGTLLFRALTSLDYPLIQGTFIILIVTLIIAMLIGDFVYAFIDPRIKTGYLER